MSIETRPKIVREDVLTRQTPEEFLNPPQITNINVTLVPDYTVPYSTTE
jgi:hypothetical protein